MWNEKDDAYFSAALILILFGWSDSGETVIQTEAAAPEIS